MPQNDKNFCPTSYLMNLTSYDFSFWYTCVKWWYLQHFFFYFFKSLIFPVSINAKRKFWGVPHLPHVSDFFVKLWLILSQLELSRTELPKCTPNILMENCDHTICPVLSILLYMTQLIRCGFLESLSLS